MFVVRVCLEPQASAALLLARNITGRLRGLCVHRPWTMLSRSSSRRRVASCSYAAFYRENRTIGRNTGRITGNTRPRFFLPGRTRVIAIRTPGERRAAAVTAVAIVQTVDSNCSPRRIQFVSNKIAAFPFHVWASECRSGAADARASMRSFSSASFAQLMTAALRCRSRAPTCG